MASVPHEEERFTDSDVPAAEHRRSTLDLVKNVVLDLTRVVEDSTELVGASVREELAQFREDMARYMLAMVAVVIGGSLASAGLAMLLADWLGNWSLTLIIFGAIYFIFAVALWMGRPRQDDEGWR